MQHAQPVATPPTRHLFYYCCEGTPQDAQLQPVQLLPSIPSARDCIRPGSCSFATGLSLYLHQGAYILDIPRAKGLVPYCPSVAFIQIFSHSYSAYIPMHPQKCAHGA